jgi:hypothetical protein
MVTTGTLPQALPSGLPLAPWTTNELAGQFVGERIARHEVLLLRVVLFDRIFGSQARTARRTLLLLGRQTPTASGTVRCAEQVPEEPSNAAPTTEAANIAP